MKPFLTSLKTAWSDSTDSNGGMLAAGIAYYAFLSFMPLLAAMVLCYGVFVEPSVVAKHTAWLAQVLPGDVATLINEQIESVVETRKGAKGWGLFAAIALSLFGARVAAGAVINGMNIAFKADENRGIIKSNLLAIAITLGAITAFGLVGGVTTIVTVYFSASGSGIVSFIVVTLLGLMGAMFAYRIIPNIRHASWSAVFRGALLFALGWTGASVVFGYYAANFGNYNATYGSLGAIAIFLTWMFLSAYLLLLGAFFVRASDPKSIKTA